MRRLFSVLALLTAGATGPAAFAFDAAAPYKDRDAILKFAGCFEVTFDFKETFARTPGYKFQQPYHNQATEYVVVDEDTGDRISLQHILVFRGAVQKHWRQEWIHEPDSRYDFKGDATWEKVAIDSQERTGRWVQKVYNVDDSPRYECAAPWVHWGDNHYWECETGRPLPRREYSTRSDYQIMQARNRQAIRADGWVMEEDNGKVVVEPNGKRKLLVKEKGENQYFRIDDARCKAGAEYWAKSQTTWRAIVGAWNDVYRTHSKLQLVTPAQGQSDLWEVLFEFADRAEKEKLNPSQITEGASILMKPYVR